MVQYIVTFLALQSPIFNPPTPNTIQKSFDKQKGTQNEVDNPQQQWHASIKERIINQLLKILPPALPAKAKLRANWAISTLSDDDPTRVIDGLY
jgi:hypothetical protein